MLCKILTVEPPLVGRIRKVELTCTNRVTTTGHGLPTCREWPGRATRQVACSFDRLVFSLTPGRYVSRGRQTRCLQTTWRTTRHKNTFDPPPTPIGVSQKPSRGLLKEGPRVPARKQVRKQVSGVATRAANTSSVDELSGQEAMSAP